MPFDLTVFAQSFLLVQPLIALKKVGDDPESGGRLPLLFNRITPTSPTRHHLEEIDADYLHVTQRPIVDAVHNDELIAMKGGRFHRRTATLWSNGCTIPPTTGSTWCSPPPAS